jgi:hypothetical protein
MQKETQQMNTQKEPLNEHPTYRREPTLGPDAVIFVTKNGEEGILTLDKGDGRLLTKHEEMPEWGNGLVMAMLAERIGYYNVKLGADHELVKAHLASETVAFEDISWMARSDGGEDKDILADGEVRLQNVNSILTDMGVIAQTDEGTLINGSSGTITRAELEEMRPQGAVSLSEANATTADMASSAANVEDLTEQSKTGTSQG